jgi:ABC-type phosphate transport system substrate-binding protein
MIPGISLARWLVSAAVGCLLSLPLETGHAQTEGGFRVIVNSANPVTDLSRSELQRLFLRKTQVWKEGGTVQPLDLGESSDVRQRFSKRVLGKDVAAIKGYWQQLIFTGRGVPPVEKASEAEVIALVAANRYAIGYVSAGAELASGVKVVSIAP